MPSLCECPVNNDPEPGREACQEEHERGWLCHREKGHDGPHAACSFDQHPVMTWGGDDDGR